MTSPSPSPSPENVPDDDPTLTRFRARAADAGAEVTVVRDTAALTHLAIGLSGDGAVAVAGNLAARHPDLADRLGDRALPARDLADMADVAVGLASGIHGVAETGSVLVDEHALRDRAVSMLSRTLVYGLPRGALVESLDEIADWLASSGLGNGYRALVTGPSRSADIERSLTIGVQGPSALHIALVDDWEPEPAERAA